MNNIRRIGIIVLLMTNMMAYADQEIVVKTDNGKDGFKTVSRIVLDLTGENPVVRSNDKSVVYTSDSPLILQLGNTGDEDAISKVKANDVRNSTVYDLSGRVVSKPKKGVYIRNGKKIVIK